VRVTSEPTTSTRVSVMSPSGTPSRRSSSSVVSVGYDADDQKLELEYVNGGVYQYFGVPDFVHRRLLTSNSPGAFVNAVVKPNYEFREVR